MYHTEFARERSIGFVTLLESFFGCFLSLSMSGLPPAVLLFFGVSDHKDRLVDIARHWTGAFSLLALQANCRATYFMTNAFVI